MFKDKNAFWLILITGLGYFSDSYDVFLYNVMRVPSLTELGLSGDPLMKTGIWILNAQVFGALLGGFFFGLLGSSHAAFIVGAIVFLCAALAVLLMRETANSDLKAQH